MIWLIVLVFLNYFLMFFPQITKKKGPLEKRTL